MATAGLNGDQHIRHELDQIDGYFVAFTHSGATLGLIAGELLAREILTGEKSPLLETFRPARFSAALV